MSLYTVTFDSETSQNESDSDTHKNISIDKKTSNASFANQIHEPISDTLEANLDDTGELEVKKHPNISDKTSLAYETRQKNKYNRSPRSRKPVKRKELISEKEDFKKTETLLAENSDQQNLIQQTKDEETSSENQKLRRITNEDNHLEEEEYHESVYRVERINTFTLTGPKRHFRMLCGGKPIMFTNTVSRLSSECTQIYTGIESNEETITHLGSISYSDEINFDLKLDDGTLASINFSRYDTKSPRNVACRIIASDDHGSHIDLISKKPKLHPSGQWTISFGHIRTITSIKNCILEDLHGNQYAKIFKVDDDALHVIVDDAVQPAIAFFMAIANFISRI